ncbi:Phosphocarrier protein HPr [Borrelia nietonii YOR]|uniref:Phosphocarrier protein HPr n=1 Tax=Borrelia nietonii YOR TaxID=1293576 RepID=A0ABM5PH72_9SPIR|nr:MULTISPECIES: HPr family phosphocarrier protein [Borrelia]AHH03438.1 Phosphocarrier protein HPr [Borrelia nietonii YOR]AHH13948.1 Phosphocarrier protein HPr [Borrelia hermsii MTW]UPA09155.1 HPr family phosphocarrier protein [Borrelia nietonii YOR]
MQTITIEITNKEGLHARPSSMIAEFASKYPSCNIKLVTEDGREADAKSTVEIMILGVIYKEKIKIIASGKEATEIIDKLSELLKSNFKKEMKE